MMAFRKKQRGFSLVTAIFLLVVLAILGTYMVAMSVTQNQSTALSVQGTRAWYAALSGLEWGAYQVNPATGAGSCPSVPTVMTIEGFTVTLKACSSTAITEGSENYNIFELTVNASRGVYGQLDYVSRTVRALIGGPS